MSYTAFIQAMADVGITGADPIDDGQLHRFNIKGDKHGSKNGWYVLHGNGIPAGAFGNWKTGESYTWCSKHHTELTDADRRENRRRIEVAKRQRKAAQQQHYLEAANKASPFWADAMPADPGHPYLQVKRIQPNRLRQQADLLLVPMMYGDRLVNIQRIRPDGQKRFLFGGQVSGAYYPMMRSQKILFICEGAATAHTIHQLQNGASVVAAMNAGNLTPVARHFRQRYPDLPIVIAGDNDRNTGGNPGLKAAHEAAAAVDGVVVWPEFPAGSSGSDFNDKFLLEQQS